MSKLYICNIIVITLYIVPQVWTKYQDANDGNCILQFSRLYHKVREVRGTLTEVAGPRRVHRLSLVLDRQGRITTIHCVPCGPLQVNQCVITMFWFPFDFIDPETLKFRLLIYQCEGKTNVWAKILEPLSSTVALIFFYFLLSQDICIIQVQLGTM